MGRSRNRLALFAGQVDEAYQSRFISGFNKKALAADFDVCIFSMYRKYQDTPENEQGESNIFSLMNPEKFAGAVILKDSIQTENAANAIRMMSLRSHPGKSVPKSTGFSLRPKDAGQRRMPSMQTSIVNSTHWPNRLRTKGFTTKS